MANKADLITAIREAYTLNPGITDWTEVEDALIDNTDSVVNNIYGASVSDDEATETYTTSNANFDYDVTFRKVGSSVTMTGRFTANSSLSAGSFTIFTLTDTDLLQESGTTYYASSIKTNTPDTLPIQLIVNTLVTSASILSGEGFKFTLKYNTEN